MSFLTKIDELISANESTLKTIHRAKSDKNYYVNFVTEEINTRIKEEGERHKNNVGDALAATLSAIPAMIEKSFNHLENTEMRILAIQSAYVSVRNLFIQHEESKNSTDTKIEKLTESLGIDESDKEKASGTVSKETSDRKIRKIGERPDNKISKRKKKSKRKAAK